MLDTRVTERAYKDVALIYSHARWLLSQSVQVINETSAKRSHLTSSIQKIWLQSEISFLSAITVYMGGWYIM